MHSHLHLQLWGLGEALKEKKVDGTIQKYSFLL